LALTVWQYQKTEELPQMAQIFREGSSKAGESTF
jgi:hypothetical protein